MEIDQKLIFFLPWQDQIGNRESVPRTVVEKNVLAATVVHKYHQQYRDSETTQKQWKIEFAPILDDISKKLKQRKYGKKNKLPSKSINRVYPRSGT